MFNGTTINQLFSLVTLRHNTKSDFYLALKPRNIVKEYVLIHDQSLGEINIKYYLIL